MTDQELLAAFRDARATLTADTFDAASELAFEIARRNTARRDAAHEAFHEVRMVRVEARRGYRGQTVCANCYRGREWDGAYQALVP